MDPRNRVLDVVSVVSTWQIRLNDVAGAVLGGAGTSVRPSYARLPQLQDAVAGRYTKFGDCSTLMSRPPPVDSDHVHVDILSQIITADDPRRTANADSRMCLVDFTFHESAVPPFTALTLFVGHLFLPD